MSEIYIPPTLINGDYLKAYSPIPINFSIESVRPFISIAEETWIVPILGRALYSELLKEVNENQITDVNSSLLVKIYMLESMAVLYESLPFIRSHISEVGITLGKSDNSDSISSSDLNNITNHLRSQLEVLKTMLKDFLEANKDCYPLYRSDDCSSCTVSNDECNAFMLTLWNTRDLNEIGQHRSIYWYSLYKTIKDHPNIDIRLYSNKVPRLY